MKYSKKISFKELKNQVLNHYKVKNSQQLKKISTLAAKLDLRYKKNWQVLSENINSSMNNLISLANYVVEKGNGLNLVDTGLKSLSEDLADFEKKIETDFENKRKKSRKFRESLTYL